MLWIIFLLAFEVLILFFFFVVLFKIIFCSFCFSRFFFSVCLLYLKIIFAFASFCSTRHTLSEFCRIVAATKFAHPIRLFTNFGCLVFWNIVLWIINIKFYIFTSWSAAIRAFSFATTYAFRTTVGTVPPSNNNFTHFSTSLVVYL